jgi:hypothetical protein
MGGFVQQPVLGGIWECPWCGEIVDDAADHNYEHVCDPDRARTVAMGENPDEVEVIDPGRQLEKFQPHEALMGSGLTAKRRTSSTPKRNAKIKAKLKRRRKKRRM